MALAGGLIVVMYGELTSFSQCIIDQACLILLFAVEWVPLAVVSARPLRLQTLLGIGETEGSSEEGDLGSLDPCLLATRR